MNDNETSKLKEMALDAMIKAIDDAMKNAKEQEEHARKWIEHDARENSLQSSSIVNHAKEIQEAQIIQRALSNAYSYMCLYLNA